MYIQKLMSSVRTEIENEKRRTKTKRMIKVQAVKMKVLG